MRREVVQTRQDVLWVHPRHRVVASLPVGFAKDLEGPTSDASPAGDVAFHALREYQVGDDYRHIHWLSTARAGEVMVRHYVDNRRPHLGVVLHDRRADWEDPDRYELGVRIAASLSVSSMVHRQPVSTLHGTDTILGARHAGTSEDLLDRLTEVRAGEGASLADAVGHLRRTELQVSATALVVGPGVARDDLLASVRSARRLGRVVLVRVDAPEPLAVPGAKVLEVAALDELVAAWNRMVR
nr:DUF58 domain-containing protein [Salsipaludibacter albus]